MLIYFCNCLIVFTWPRYSITIFYVNLFKTRQIKPKKKKEKKRKILKVTNNLRRLSRFLVVSPENLVTGSYLCTFMSSTPEMKCLTHLSSWVLTMLCLRTYFKSEIHKFLCLRYLSVRSNNFFNGFPSLWVINSNIHFAVEKNENTHKKEYLCFQRKLKAPELQNYWRKDD